MDGGVHRKANASMFALIERDNRFSMVTLNVVTFAAADFTMII